MPSMTLDIRFGSELHKKILDAVRDRIMMSRKDWGKYHQNWKNAEERALAYLPEREVDAARRVQREGGKPQYTTIQVPYSYAVLMAAHTYWSTVFMSRTPILQFAGQHGEGEQQVQALEALMSYQVHNGGAIPVWYIWLLDAGKYGVGIIGNYWDTEYSRVSRIVEQEETFLGISTGRTKKVKVSERLPGYEGNKWYNIRPFDFFPDPRVPIRDFQKGEFCGVYTEIGWNNLVKKAEQGYFTNVEKLREMRESPSPTDRDAGSGQIELPDVNQIDSEVPKTGGRVIPAYQCHIELEPNRWGLGNSDIPEKWVFTVTADYKIVIGASPLGAYHDKFPFDVLEMEPEGYGLASRGYPDILQPIQDTVDWLINSHFYNVRKVMNDQFVVDPSRVVMSDVMDPLPGGIIRMKSAGWGTDPATAIKQLNVVDITQNHIRDLGVVLGLGERAAGVNDQMMGVLNLGSGRKTATEVRTSSTFGINRLKTSSEYGSAQAWEPMSRKAVQNAQQYYSGEKKFRIVGDFAMEAGQQFIDVTPESITGFYEFVPVDGTLPVDRFAQATLWRELLASIVKFPQIAQGYDLGRIFAWVAQLAGLKNINQFRIQVQPDAALQAQAQQGNTVPMPTNGAGVPNANLQNSGAGPVAQRGE